MSYVVLARKYRPQTFSEVYAQEHITDILQNAIKSNRIHHAYLFNGPRGVGKTSLARIFAKSLNCVEGPTTTPCNKCSNCLEITASTSTDVIEIDGASNNGVDDIRDLQEELMYAPAHSKYKIYIIDEVHMLSKSAFNALLKTLEEPPENVVFIFATTEPHKVLPTIISRCQRYDFKRIPVDSIVKRVKALAEEEQVEIDSESIYLIARKADGGLRDALSLMDQVLSYCVNQVNIDQVRNIFGILPSQVFYKILRNIRTGETKAIIDELHLIFEQGTELQEMLNNLLEFLRISILRKNGIAPGEINPEEYGIYDEIANSFSLNELLYIISSLIQTRADIRTSSNPQLILEVVMVKLSQMDEMQDLSQILANLDKLRGQSPLPSSPQARPEPRTAAQQSNPIHHTAPAPSAPSPQHEAVLEKLDLTLESLTDNWQRLIARVRKSSSTTAVSLSKAQVVEVKANRITLLVEGSTFLASIEKNKELIETHLSDIFNGKSILHLQKSEAEAPKTVEIKRTTLDDLKKENPEIADYIRITDSKLISG
ncbi:MAG: DNA polymerase III subunit gamma/tau [Candidatus Cloacimonetes bacterium HGW-Cloacimonetes-2]|jgi:DNA polymerase-3 subunit gamma/tau|nr:MAG: DNA polymerase III subunit gamma/tau [Candidatus Cloacimonetes bacterium HGW-Cloacimonetes-2]